MEPPTPRESLVDFGFDDVAGFADFIVYVYSCAPELFPEQDWLPPEKQMTLARAFVGLRLGLDLAAAMLGEGRVSKCRALIDAAHVAYQSGRDTEGQRKLEEVERLLKKAQVAHSRKTNAD